MATKQITRNIALTPRLEKLVKDKVASGRYQSASEVVRDGLRLLEERDEHREKALARVRDDIEVGWRQSERGEILDGSAVFAEIRKLSKQRRARSKKRA
jgi:antitoxin ParD1/3/4